MAHNNDDPGKINDQLIAALQDLLAVGDWEASLFLRTAHKKLKDILDQAVALSNQSGKNLPVAEFHQKKIKEGCIKIYVSLYQSDPYNLVKWENTLKSIREYSINRPIYRHESHVLEMIRSKQGSPNEGYVIIYIDPTQIIPPYSGKIVEDRWGHELLTLRDNSLLPDNIIEFVHQGRHYDFVDGKLLLKSDVS